jgi:hypothetical protein
LPFWESTLKAPNFVLSIIAHGYNGPANAGEPTNALALRGRFEGAVRFDSDEQRRFWAESLAPKRLAQGAWILCKRTDVVCTAPMFLVQKSTPGEFRDIHDLRELNEGLAPPHFRLDSLDDVAMLLGRGWLMATLDLESAYHHVELSPAFRRFVAFDWRRGHWPAAAAAEAAVDRTGGTPLAAVCTVLPFGMSTSPWVYTRVVKPLLEHWRRKGIMCVLFYDDLLVMAPARSRMDWARAEVVKDLTCAGVSINWKKSQWEPCQVCIYLGFEIDSLAGQFRLPEAKRHRLVGQLRRFAAVAARGPVRAREIASLAGRIVAARRAIAPAMMIARPLFQLLRGVHTRQWSAAVPVTEDARQEALALAAELDNWNGRSIWPPAIFAVLQTDAGEEGLGATLSLPASALASALVLRASGSLDQTVIGRSSGLRELAAWAQALQHFLAQDGVRARCEGLALQPRLDSTAAVAALTKLDSPVPEMAAWTRVIWKTALTARMELRPAVWIPRECNSEEDALSRLRAWAEETPELQQQLRYQDWGVSTEAFRAAAVRWGTPTYDLFASTQFHQTAAFASRFWAPDSTATDAFTLDWNDLGLVWMTPPFAILLRTLAHLIWCKAKGILLCPRWEGAAWWPLLRVVQNGEPMVLPATEVLVSEEMAGRGELPEPLQHPWELLLVPVDGGRVQIFG